MKVTKKTIQNTTYCADDVLQQGDLLAGACNSRAEKDMHAVDVLVFCMVLNFAENDQELIEAARTRLDEEYDINCFGKNYVDGYDVAAKYVARDDEEYAAEIVANTKQLAHNIYQHLETI